MNKDKQLFKLYNYCIQYYLYNNYPLIYLTDEQWIDIINKRKKFPYSIILAGISIIRTYDLASIVKDFLLISINYNPQRFKNILDNVGYINLDFSLPTSLHYIIV